MKRLLWLVLCGIMVLTLSACEALSFLDDLGKGTEPNTIQSMGIDGSDGDESSGNDASDSAVKLSEDITYHNSYLGVSYTAPAGWWLYYVNEDNFDTEAALTQDASVLDIYPGSDYSSIFMISLGNLQYSNKSGHLGIDLTAEKADGIDTLADYVAYFEEYMMAPTQDEDAYSLESTDQVTINGVAYELRVFGVPYEGELSYYLMSLTAPVKNDYYMSVISTYWPQNTTAVDDVISLVEKGLVLSE